MTRVYERVLEEDLNLGVGTAQVQNPGGGVLNGHQVNLTTFSLAGAGGSKVTATWDPGEVLASQSVSTTVSVPGAAFGDICLPSFSLALSGLVLSAEVDAADVVRVTLSNTTGAAIDLASGTITLLVFRVR